VASTLFRDLNCRRSGPHSRRRADEHETSPATHLRNFARESAWLSLC